MGYTPKEECIPFGHWSPFDVIHSRVDIEDHMFNRMREELKAMKLEHRIDQIEYEVKIEAPKKYHRGTASLEYWLPKKWISEEVAFRYGLKS